MSYRQNFLVIVSMQNGFDRFDVLFTGRDGIVRKQFLADKGQLLNGCDMYGNCVLVEMIENNNDDRSVY